MGHKARKGNSHNDLVKILQLKLYREEYYDRIQLFFEYCRHGQVGEVDLLRMADGFWDFYEVKCKRTTKSVNKAHEQYDRFKLAYPNHINEGFLYTGNKGLERL